MAANILTTVGNWTVVPGSNQPDTSDPAGSICDDMHAILAAVRKEHQYDGVVTAEAGGTVTPTARINVLDYTSNATVTQIIGVEGQERTFVVTTGKAPLFKHSATLVMPGGVDWQGSVGDVATFIAESASTWRCASFVKAAGNFFPPTMNVGNFTAGDIVASSIAGARVFNVASGSVNDTYATLETITAATSLATLTTLAERHLVNLYTSASTAIVININRLAGKLGNRPKLITIEPGTAGGNPRSTAAVIQMQFGGTGMYYTRGACDITTMGADFGIAWKGGASCIGTISYGHNDLVGSAAGDAIVFSGGCLERL
jgi:hypothetical protein